MTICYVELYDKKYHGDNNLEGHYISIWEPLSLIEQGCGRWTELIQSDPVPGINGNDWKCDPPKST